MYEGKIISDISDCFPEKGKYYVRISAKYGNVRTDIYFWITII